MPKKKSGAAYSMRDLAKRAARGEDRTDWTRASRMTRARIEKAVAGDPDEAGMIVEWDKARIAMPKAKALFAIRLDQDVLDWFRAQGKGYQTRINAILRSYIDQISRSPRG
jgi:uncharacterized protein (DUF4415 family)